MHTLMIPPKVALQAHLPCGLQLKQQQLMKASPVNRICERPTKNQLVAAKEAEQLLFGKLREDIEHTLRVSLFNNIAVETNQPARRKEIQERVFLKLEERFPKMEFKLNDVLFARNMALPIPEIRSLFLRTTEEDCATVARTINAHLTSLTGSFLGTIIEHAPDVHEYTYKRFLVRHNMTGERESFIENRLPSGPLTPNYVDRTYSITTPIVKTTRIENDHEITVYHISFEHHIYNDKLMPAFGATIRRPPYIDGILRNTRPSMRPFMGFVAGDMCREVVKATQIAHDRWTETFTKSETREEVVTGFLGSPALTLFGNFVLSGWAKSDLR